jgi:hypothetical protein
VLFLQTYLHCSYIPNKSIFQAYITFQNIKIKVFLIFLLKFTTNFYVDTTIDKYNLFNMFCYLNVDYFHEKAYGVPADECIFTSRRVHAASNDCLLAVKYTLKYLSLNIVFM